MAGDGTCGQTAHSKSNTCHDLDPADGVAGFHIHGEAIEAERQARRNKDPHGGMPYANGWQVMQARPLGL